MGSINDSLAMTMAFSAVPPTPIPRIPGGHQPAPRVDTVASTQSTKLSLGLRMANLDLFSEPPPLAASLTSTVSPGTRRVWITAGVLSPVFLRPPIGGATTEARRILSGLV